MKPAPVATGPGCVHFFAIHGTRLGRTDIGVSASPGVIIVRAVSVANLARADDGSVLCITADNALVRIRATTRCLVA